MDVTITTRCHLSQNSGRGRWCFWGMKRNLGSKLFEPCPLVWSGTLLKSCLEQYFSLEWMFHLELMFKLGAGVELGVAV